nr:choice-of-anchor M domain-containing protein [Arcanobacterium pluranimalium]
MVPADLKVPAGSAAALPGATPDAQNQVPHVCAGKKLLHHAHVDAGYVTRVNGKFTVTVVDGQAVVKDPSKICVRLAPDARTSDGLEVSRMIVPDDANYSFLGSPKSIVWHAPQEDIDRWRPVWAGLGSFDAHHEVNVPTNFYLNEVELKFSKVDGPGKVDVWRTVGFGAPNRGLSSDNTLPPTILNVGAHGHWSWTFSKAGVYHLGFEASYRTSSTEKVVSEPSTITWLVGSDKDVQLPDGTTKLLNPIKISMEDVLAGKAPAPQPGGTTGGTTPGGTNGGTTPAPSPGQAPSDAEQAIRKQIIDATDSQKFIPKMMVSAGKYVIRSAYPEPGTSENNFLETQLVDATSANAKKVIDDDVKVGIEVPDSLRQTVKPEATNLYSSSDNGTVWQLPETASDKNAALGFDFSAITKEKITPPIVYDISYKVLPKDGRYLSGNMENNIFKIRLDSSVKPARDVLDEGKELSQSHIFTRPGMYLIDYDVNAKDAQGKFSYDARKVYFAVGNDTINVLRKMQYENLVAAAQSAGKDPATVPVPTMLPSTGTGVTPPAPKPGDVVVPGSGTTGPVTGPAKLSIDDARAQLLASLSGKLGAVITKGHMDQALAYDKDIEAKAFVDDTAVPSKPVLHESGTFAYAVPDSAWAIVPDKQEFAELKSAAPKGTWILPEAQLEGLPWVGFSTMRVNYDLLGKEGVKVSLRNVRGPGRMLTGQYSLGTGFVKRLDTADLNKVISYPYRSHDHQAFYFTAPGTYTMDFVYTMQLLDGKKVEKVLTARFLVGDTSITAGKERLPGGTTPTDSAAPVTDGTGRQPLAMSELVSRLNKGEAIPVWRDSKQGSATPAPVPTSGNQAPSSSAGAPATNASAYSASAGNASGSGATAGARSVRRGGATPNIAQPASAGSAGGEVANALAATPTPADPNADPNANSNDPNAIAGTENAVQSLEAPEEHVASLMNPENGSKAMGNGGTPLWQWGLLGTGVLAMIGAGAYIFAIRK